MKCTLVALLFCLSFVVQSQSSIDLITVSGFYGLAAAYPHPYSGKATEFGSMINLKLPVSITDKTIWFSDLTHTYYSINHSLNPKPTGMITTMNLHAFIVQTGIVHKLNDANAIQLLLVPRYTTAFDGHSAKNWQFGCVGLYEHRFNQKLLMRFGVLFNQELFGPLVVPLIFSDWKITERWSMTGLFPINLKIGYQLNERLALGLSHFGFITTYRINTQEFESDYIERNSIDETLFVRWKVVGNLYLEPRFGYSLNRIYEQYEADQKMDFRLSLFALGDDRSKKNITFESGVIASLRVIYSLPLTPPSK